MGWHSVAVLPLNEQNKDVTFLALPPDLQKPTHRPNTNVMSDKDRIATSRHPELDPKELRKILATPPPGRRDRAVRVQPSPRHRRQRLRQNPALRNLSRSGQAAQRPQFDSNQTAQLQMPSSQNASKYSGGMTAGSAIQQATQAAAARRAAGGGGQAGDFGLGTGAHGRQQGALTFSVIRKAWISGPTCNAFCRT